MPSGSREVETTYDVAPDAVLPDLAGLPGVARISEPVLHELDATYYDVPGLRLAAAGITLRRRTGGDDEGWHLKLPVGGARQKIRVPLGRETRTPPAALRRIVAGVVRDGRLGPVAHLRTERRVLSLLGEDGRVLALVCDDRVHARRLGVAGEEGMDWRECEVELHAGGKKLAKAVRDRLREAGVRRSEHPSKLGRVLDVLPAPRLFSGVAASASTTERQLLHRQLEVLAGDVVRLDPLVRADVPDAVHQMRITCRRLRGVLGTFTKCFDRSLTDPVRADLRWLAGELGRPRDLEVLHQRLGALLAAERAELVRGDVRRTIDTELRTAHRAAHRAGAEAMESPRYTALVDALSSWAAGPPWRNRRDRPALAGLGLAVGRDWARLERAVSAARAATDTAQHVAALHAARRAAKHLRYAAEALAPMAGPDALRLAAAAMAVQDALGEHHDAAVAGEELVVLADVAHAAGQDTFTYGVLRARVDLLLADSERAYDVAWAAASDPQLRHWL